MPQVSARASSGIIAPAAASGDRVITPPGFTSQGTNVEKLLARNPQVRERYEACASRAMILKSRLEGLWRLAEQYREQFGVAAGELARLQRRAEMFGVADAVGPGWNKPIVLQSNLDEAAAERDRAKALMNQARAANDSANLEANAERAVVEANRALLGSFRADAILELVPPIVVKDPAKALSSAAADVAALVAERKKVEAASLPAALVKERAHQQIARLAARGAPHVGGLSRGHPVEWDRDATGSVDVLAIIAHLFGPMVIETIDAAVDRTYADGKVLAMEPSAQKAALEKIDAQILSAERVAAASVWALRADGHDTAFPRGLAARAVLGIV